MSDTDEQVLQALSSLCEKQVATLVRYRKALEFYASYDNWFNRKWPENNWCVIHENDMQQFEDGKMIMGGKLAREALKDE